MYIEAVLAFVALWYLVLYLKWRKNIYWPLEKLPGDRRYPIIGTEYIFIGVPREELFNAFMQNADKYAPLHRTWNGSIPELHIQRPEHLELILTSSTHISKGEQYKRLEAWLGQGLLTGTGVRWHQRRKLITPTFHFKILEHFVSIFVDKTDMLLKLLDAKADGQIHNIYPDITHCALDIICETAMGVNVNAMSNENNEYIKAVYDISELFLWRGLRPYIPDLLFKILPQGRRLKQDLKILHGFSNKVISERKHMLKMLKRDKNYDKENLIDLTEARKYLSFLDLLLEASEDGKLLSDNDIREEVDTFMFEGHDTTTAAMCWTLFLLGNHPEIQENVFEEVKTVLHGKSTPKCIAELNELKCLDRVIKEALRLYPSVPFIIRDIQEDIKIDNFKIPAGVQAVLHIYRAQRDPVQFPDPDKFDPDRFLPENSLQRHPYAYVPFSAGPRNCIGQKFAMFEEKTILASIINRFKITAIEDMENVKITTDIILRPTNGVLVRLERRK